MKKRTSTNTSDKARTARLRGERPGAHWRDHWIFVSNNKDVVVVHAAAMRGARSSPAAAERSVLCPQCPCFVRFFMGVIARTDATPISAVVHQRIPFSVPCHAYKICYVNHGRGKLWKPVEGSSPHASPPTVASCSISAREPSCQSCHELVVLVWRGVTTMETLDCRPTVAKGFSRQHGVSRLAVGLGRLSGLRRAATAARRCPAGAT